MDTAFHRALQLSYRGNSDDKLDEALELLQNNDHAQLLHVKAKRLRPPYTWAKIADTAVDLIARALLEGDDVQDACEDAQTLADRLATRDASPSARVTTTLRTRITQVVRAASCLTAALGLRDGKLRPDDHDALGQLIALRSAWYALRREHSSDADPKWLLDVVQRAAGRVLASEAGGGSKAMASRAVAAWTPPASPAPPTPPRSPDAQPAAKRIKLGDGEGEAVSWDSDDDF